MSRPLPALSHDAADPIDRLMSLTHDQVLRFVPTDGGEMDSLAQVPTSVRRSLASARLVSAGGLRADVLLHEVQGSAQCPSELVNANPDQFVSWYVAECVAGLEFRKVAREGGTVWHEQTEPEPWPAELVEWLERLVYGAKVELLGELAAWRFDGAPCPTIPDTEWATKMVRKFERLAGVVVPRKSRKVSADEMRATLAS